MRIWKPNFTQPMGYDSNNWCAQDLYNFSVSSLIACHGLILTSFIALLCIVVCKKIEDNDISDFRN